MALPPLAPTTALADELGEGTLTGSAAVRARRALAKASALVRAVTGLSFMAADGVTLGTVPDPVFEVTLSVAARWFQNPRGVIGESDGQFSYRLADGEHGGVFLTAQEQKMLGTVPGVVVHSGLLSVPLIPAHRGPLGDTSILPTP